MKKRTIEIELTREYRAGKKGWRTPPTPIRPNPAADRQLKEMAAGGATAFLLYTPICWSLSYVVPLSFAAVATTSVLLFAIVYLLLKVLTDGPLYTEKT